jgi:hypothetical protein
VPVSLKTVERVFKSSAKGAAGRVDPRLRS